MLKINRLPHPAFRYSAIATSRKIPPAPALLAVALAALAPLAAPAPARAAPQRLAAADLFQAGQELVFTVRTAKPVPLARLQARPDARRAASRYLCLGISRAGHRGERRFCLGGPEPHGRVGTVVVNAAGRPLRRDAVAAKVKRPNPRKLVVAMRPQSAGLSPQRYRWRVLESTGCTVRSRCAHQLPAAGASHFRLRPVRPVGCTGGGAGLVTHGSREHPVVALTFDDGPSDYTAGFLRVLREKGVPGTFFVVGQQIPGREATLRQMLAEGHEIGDHTMNHVELPGYSQIAGAASLIRGATHFQPCLFRPPGGAVSSGVIATAGGLGMTTVNWDVDPFDWQTPGSGAIYSRIVGATRSGSIVLMHDGGGPRGGTLAALPSIIDTLRGRGYRFATVSELLGHKLIYRPYG
ncbi:MAG: polysaccharide deacetylase family protein [Solirubrobacterales bacterium]